MTRAVLAAMALLACDDTAGLDQSSMPLARIYFSVSGDVDALGLDDDMGIFANLVWQERVSLDRVCLEQRDVPEAAELIALGCARRDFAPTHHAGMKQLSRAELDGRTLSMPLFSGPRDGASSAVLAVVISAERYGTPGLDLLISGQVPSPSLPVDVVIAASTTPHDNRYSVVAYRDLHNREGDCAGFMDLLGAIQDSSGIDYGFSRVDVDKTGGVQRCDAVRLDHTPIRLTLGRGPALTQARCVEQDDVIFYAARAPDLDDPYYCIDARHFATIDPDSIECPAIQHYATEGCYGDAYCQNPEFETDTPPWWPCAEEP